LMTSPGATVNVPPSTIFIVRILLESRTSELTQSRVVILQQSVNNLKAAVYPER